MGEPSVAVRRRWYNSGSEPMAKEKREEVRIIAKNRKARFEYDLLEKWEAGLVLQGSEVKSVRDGKVSLNESYARSKGGEFFVFNMDVAPYVFAGPLAHEPKRPRKLLLNRREIDRLTGKTREKGLTVIPTALYLKKGLVKLEIALARGRQKHDKRDAIRKREADRELRNRAMK